MAVCILVCILVSAAIIASMVRGVSLIAMFHVGSRSSSSDWSDSMMDGRLGRSVLSVSRFWLKDKQEFY